MLLSCNGGRKREKERGGEGRRGEKRREERKGKREKRQEREPRTCAFSVFGGVEVVEGEHLQHLDDNKCWSAVISVLFQMKKKKKFDTKLLS